MEGRGRWIAANLRTTWSTQGIPFVKDTGVCGGGSREKEGKRGEKRNKREGKWRRNRLKVGRNGIRGHKSLTLFPEKETSVVYLKIAFQLRWGGATPLISTLGKQRPTDL